MNTKFYILLVALLSNMSFAFAQVVTTLPYFPKSGDRIEIYFDAAQGNQGLIGYTGDLYAHTGVITENSSSGSDWKYVKTDWGENTAATKLTRISTDYYMLAIEPDVYEYYGVPASEAIEQMAFVFRSADNSKEGKTAAGGDIYVNLYDEGLHTAIIAPAQSPALYELGEEVIIKAVASNADSMDLFLADTLFGRYYENSLEVNLTATTPGNNVIGVTAYFNDEFVSDAGSFFVVGEPEIAQLPQTGLVDGINYIDESTVTLVLFAPYKKFVFAVGDFNDWQLTEEHLMKVTPDKQRYWITLSNLDGNKKYIYQYWIDKDLRIADPYTEIISDPWHDKYIPASVYPNLPTYPEGKASGIASVFQINKSGYEWQITDFQRPTDIDLVIYELLVRDFTEEGTFNAVYEKLDYLESLGVNAIEFMPVNEFEGNDSWGYNPSFYFALDKAYGTPNDFKKLVDECHRRGMAVIIDMVYNHSFGQSPFVQMYFDASSGNPTAQNPWYNVTSPNTAYSWGYDFDHESTATKNLIDSISRYWIREYNIDGFRFDFTKGLTNKGGDGWAYDASRIAILTRMAEKIREEKENTLIILEHFADNTEERELVAHNLMVWGNMNHNYMEGAMGYNTSGKSDFSWGYYKERTFSRPNLVSYMESHDEERMIFKNLEYGNSDGENYTIADNLETSLRRAALAATFFFTVPGPKMVWQFGEMGYDYSIDYNGRVGRKPVHWDYLENDDRLRLSQVYSALIKLKTELDIFENADATLDVSGATKRIALSDDNMEMVVLGNFDVKLQQINPKFPHSGTWYEFFSGEEVEITDTEAPRNFIPGGFQIFTDVKLEKPEILATAIEPLLNQESKVLTYPNPSSGSFTIEYYVETAQSVDIQVLDAMGKTVWQTQKHAHALVPNFEVWHPTKLPQGLYFAQIKSDNSIVTKRLIKN